MKAFAFIVGMSWIANTVAHGQRAESLTRILNAPVPDWLTLAEPIKVEPAKGGIPGIIDHSQFRDPSDGIVHSKAHIEIPKLGIEFEVDYNIYPGFKSKPAVSLSPDGNNLLVNSSGYTKAYLYEIGADGQVTEIPIKVPHVTYDKGLKGFIYSWFWASNDVLLGYGSITDERGHNSIEKRLYAFHMGDRSLARLDTSALEHLRDFDPDYPEENPLYPLVVSVGKDLSELVLKVDGNTVRVKADLKAPHKLIPASSQKTIGQTSTPGRSAIISPSLAGKHAPPVRQPFPWFWLLAIVAVLLGVFSYLYTSSRHR